MQFLEKLSRTTAAILCFSSIFLPLTLFAEVEIPALTSPVIDEAGFLDNQEKQQLVNEILRLKNTPSENSGPQFQVWTTSTLQGEPIENLSIKAVEKWQLGDKMRQDGILLLIAKQERKTRIEAGRGVEGTLTDAVSSRLLRNVLKPAFREQRFFEGIGEVLEQVAQVSLTPENFEMWNKGSKVYDSNRLGNRKISNLKSSLSTIFTVLSLFIFILLKIMSVGRSRRSSIFMPGSGGFGGFRGSSGGNDWSGGGGGFSGGGSSGDW